MAPHDPLDPQQRSDRMSRIGSVNTKPELIVRRLVHSMGYRYRLHAKGLPGRPDMVFRSRRKVIFVNGCFWHQHGCRQYRMPRSRQGFWEPKLASNVVRDRQSSARLQMGGWAVLVLWECELKDREALTQRVRTFLEGENGQQGRH